LSGEWTGRGHVGADRLLRKLLQVFWQGVIIDRTRLMTVKMDVRGPI